MLLSKKASPNTLIRQDFRIGLVLFKHGFPLEYAYHRPLQESCALLDINFEALWAEVEGLFLRPSVNIPVFSEDSMPALPLLILYLKQTHHDYTRIKLPALYEYVKSLKSIESQRNPNIARIYSAFCDFKTHLLEHVAFEEEEVFPYIEALIKNVESYEAPLPLLQTGKQLTLNQIQGLHKGDDHEAEALRNACLNFEVGPDHSISYGVFMQELQSLMADLQEHSTLEDAYLFPKAEMLERFYFRKLKFLAAYN